MVGPPQARAVVTRAVHPTTYSRLSTNAKQNKNVPPPSPQPPPPQPRPPPTTLARPSEAHLLFHEDNLGAISHFGMQTFAPKSQRRPDNFAARFPPPKFSPTQLRAEQWVAAAKSFGAKYYVLVADHFSGFSLYPTTAHNYSIAHSPECPSRNIIADFVAACVCRVKNALLEPALMAWCFDAGLKHGIRPGFYYSVHANWFAGVTSFNLTNPAKQAAFEDMAMHQLAGAKLFQTAAAFTTQACGYAVASRCTIQAMSAMTVVL